VALRQVFFKDCISDFPCQISFHIYVSSVAGTAGCSMKELRLSTLLDVTWSARTQNDIYEPEHFM